MGGRGGRERNGVGHGLRLCGKTAAAAAPPPPLDVQALGYRHFSCRQAWQGGRGGSGRMSFGTTSLEPEKRVDGPPPTLIVPCVEAPRCPTSRSCPQEAGGSPLPHVIPSTLATLSQRIKLTNSSHLSYPLSPSPRYRLSSELPLLLLNLPSFTTHSRPLLLLPLPPPRRRHRRPRPSHPQHQQQQQQRTTGSTAATAAAATSR